MNRVVLIGNGFDLAHALPTNYESFIQWYWEQCGNNLLHGLGKKYLMDYVHLRLTML